MDWPAFEDPFLRDKDLRFFRFENSKSDCRLLRHSVSLQHLALQALPVDPMLNTHAGDPQGV
jgi:hypothetical protein